MGMSDEEKEGRARIFGLLVNNYGVPGRARLPLTVGPKEWYAQILVKRWKLGSPDCFREHSNTSSGIETSWNAGVSPQTAENLEITEQFSKKRFQ